MTSLGITRLSAGLDVMCLEWHKNLLQSLKDVRNATFDEVPWTATVQQIKGNNSISMLILVHKFIYSK